MKIKICSTIIDAYFRSNDKPYFVGCLAAPFIYPLDVRYKIHLLFPNRIELQVSYILVPDYPSEQKSKFLADKKLAVSKIIQKQIVPIDKINMVGHSYCCQTCAITRAFSKFPVALTAAEYCTYPGLTSWGYVLSPSHPALHTGRCLEPDPSPHIVNWILPSISWNLQKHGHNKANWGIIALGIYYKNILSKSIFHQIKVSHVTKYLCSTF